MKSLMTFNLPDALNASLPPEKRGIRRDHVRLLVTTENRDTFHDSFHHIGRFLKEGDLLVLNTSRTLPARLTARLQKRGDYKEQTTELRLAHQLEDGVWEVLPLCQCIEKGDRLLFSDNLQADVIENNEGPYSVLEFSLKDVAFYDELYRIGQPIQYEYITEPLELGDYQTVFATSPGSVEMPSAGRAFSWELLFDLKQQGINLAFLELHTGLSYLMDDKWALTPLDNKEHYKIPEETMKLIKSTKENGGRIIAVGTTVVRALETAFDENLQVLCLTGETNLYITSETVLKVVDGLITGLHEPEASHLDLLTAFLESDYLYRSYQEAIDRGYLWHEFGDIHLVL